MDSLLSFWTSADLVFTGILAISLLVMLYAMTLMSRQIRLLQYEVSVIENDLKLIGEEIRMITGGKTRVEPARETDL